jgi:hypothetical protein
VKTLHELKKQYALKQITEAEYKKLEKRYIMILIDMYCDGLITKEEIHKRMGE